MLSKEILRLLKSKESDDRLRAYEMIAQTKQQPEEPATKSEEPEVGSEIYYLKYGYRYYNYHGYIHPKEGDPLTIYELITAELKEKFAAEIWFSTTTIAFGNWKMWVRYSAKEQVWEDAQQTLKCYGPVLANCRARLEIYAEDDAGKEHCDDQLRVIEIIQRQPSVFLLDAALNMLFNLGQVVPNGETNKPNALRPDVSFLQLVPGNDKVMGYVISLQENPLDAVSWYHLGLEYHSSKQDDLALTCYENASMLDSGNQDAFRKAALILEQKVKLIFSGQLILISGEDLLLAEKAVIYNPENAGLWSYLAKMYIANNQLEKGITCFETSIRVSAHDSSAYINLGYYLILAGQPDRAFQNIEKAISLGNVTNSYLNKGHVHLIRGEKDKAIECYRISKSAFTDEGDFWNDYESDFEVLPQYGITKELYESLKPAIRVNKPN
jgi:tetratricopeptide (TPR) repeat protein